MATTLQTVAIIRAKDIFSGPVTRMANRVLAAQRRIQTTARAARSVGTGMSVGVTAPIGLAAGSLFRTAIAFDKMRNSAQAAGRLTNAQIRPVEKLARKLGSTTQFTAAQAMGAAKMLFKSGMDTERVMGTLKGTLDLAAAGELDLAQAADIATNVLTAMKLPMHDAVTAGISLTRVNDALAFAAANSNTDVRNLGESFKFAGPLASMVGMSVDDLAAAFMTMAQSGIKGSEAGVAMRSAIVRMLRPTKGMRAELAKLGIDLNDYITGAREMSSQDLVTSFKAQGFDLSAIKGELGKLFADPKLREDGAEFFLQLSQTIAKGLGDTSTLGVSKAASILNQYMGSLAEGLKVNEFFQRLRAQGAGAGSVARVFDAKQGARLATLISSNLLAENLVKIRTEAKGASAAMAKILMRGAPGEYKKMTSAYEGMMLAIAKSGVMSAAAKFMNKMAAAFKYLSQTSPALLKWGTFAVLALAAIGPLAFGIGGLVSAFGALSGVLGLVATAFRFFAGGRLLKAASGFSRLGRGISTAFKLMAGSRIAKAVARFMHFGKATRFARVALWGLRVAALAFAGVISWPVLLGVAAIAIVIAKWKELKAFFTGFWDGLKQDIDKSGLADAFASFVKWTEPARKAIGDLWTSVKKLFSFGDDTKKKIGRSIYNKTLGRLFRGLELLKKAAKGIEGIFKSASEYASQFFNKTGQTVSLLDRYNKLNYEQKRQLGMDINNMPLARQMRENYFRSLRNGPATTGSLKNNVPLPQRKPDVHIKAPVNVTITVNGVTDPSAIARQIKKQLGNELHKSLRGSFND